MGARHAEDMPALGHADCIRPAPHQVPHNQHDENTNYIMDASTARNGRACATRRPSWHQARNQSLGREGRVSENVSLTTCNDVGGGRMPSNVFDVSPLVRA
eukprot:2035144-Rhodomonas_salina.7